MMMAEESDNCELSLNTSKKDLLCDVIMVKAPNFFTLPEYGRYFEIRSPSFEFQDGSWCFLFHSLKSRKDGDRDFVVRMERINSRVSQQRVFCIITLLDVNDKNYESRANTMQVDESDRGFSMHYFNNRMPSFDSGDSLTFIIHLFQFNESIEHDTLKISQIQDLQDAAAEKRNDCKVSLKFSKLFLTCNVYTLKFSNAVQEQNSTEEFERESSSFEFDNETWCFRVHSEFYSDDPNLEDEYFNIYLACLSSEKKKHNKKIDKKQELTYLFTLQINDKKTFEFCTEDVHVDEDEDQNEYYVGCFNRSDMNNAALDAVTMIFYLLPEKSFEVGASNMSFTIIRDLNLLSQDLMKLYEDGIKKDLTLRVGETDFPVHQNILMARSDVFRATLTHDMLEKNKGVIDVPDCHPQDMKELLNYVYSGKVERLDHDNVFGLYYLADKYNMMPLKEGCSDFLKNSLSTSIISKVIQLALTHSDSELLEVATDFFVNNVNDILPTVGWMEFMKSNLIAANELFMKAAKSFKS